MNLLGDLDSLESSSDDLISCFNDPNDQIITKDWYCSPPDNNHHCFNQLFESSNYDGTIN